MNIRTPLKLRGEGKRTWLPAASMHKKGTGLLTQKPRDPTYTTLLGSHTVNAWPETPGPTRTLLHTELPHKTGRPDTRLPEQAQAILLHGLVPEWSILQCNTCYQKYPQYQYSGRGLVSTITSKHHVQKKREASLSLRTGNNQTPETRTKNQHVPNRSQYACASLIHDLQVSPAQTLPYNPTDTLFSGPSSSCTCGITALPMLLRICGGQRTKGSPSECSYSGPGTALANWLPLLRPRHIEKACFPSYTHLSPFRPAKV